MRWVGNQPINDIAAIATTGYQSGFGNGFETEAQAGNSRNAVLMGCMT
jgi:hypothetical protein